MRTKHTPGRWVAQHIHVVAMDTGDTIQAKGGAPVEVDQCIVEGCYGRNPQEAKANARLIAASPTLFAFIRKRASEGDAEAKETLDSLGLSDAVTTRYRRRARKGR